MEYWEEINNKLKPWIDTELNKTVVDLFAGCGGIDTLITMKKHQRVLIREIYI